MTLLLTVLVTQLILDLKLCGVSNDVLSVILVVMLPIAGVVGTWLEKRVYISIEPRNKRRKHVEVPIPVYTFVEEQVPFKQSWPMIEVETGKEIRIE